MFSQYLRKKPQINLMEFSSSLFCIVNSTNSLLKSRSHRMGKSPGKAHRNQAKIDGKKG